MPRASPQLIVFSYHKSGTTLFWHVMTKVSDALGLKLANHFGLVEHLDPEPDIVLLPHSLLRAPLDRPYRAIRLIRDPRDIWVSGYLYHLRCVEEWCTNTNFDPTPPIQWPLVDHSFAHLPEDWKRGFFERLNGKSYQQNLRDRPLVDGLDFELEGYSGRTFAAMRAWPMNGADALDIRLEDVMADFDATMRRIFDHFGFAANQAAAALEVARSEDIRRMDDAAILDRPQITSRTLGKWRDVLPDAHLARFESIYGDLIGELGYEPASAIPWFTGSLNTGASPIDVAAIFPAGDRDAGLIWSEPGQLAGDSIEIPAAMETTRCARIRLSADGAVLRPTAAGPGLYSFVVPRGTILVCLISRRGTLSASSGPLAQPLGRPLGVKVSEIVIRSRGREIVIAPDDPRLTAGWYEVEREGGAIWRWTDGSAALPWDGMSGPVIVTVRCATLAEYVADGVG